MKLLGNGNEGVWITGLQDMQCINFMNPAFVPNVFVILTLFSHAACLISCANDFLKM